ncbi:hypothetical protein N5912_00445 [Arcobacter lacus]|nr:MULTISPECIES: hypothetical protein [Arcobacteraceae]MCT7910286.1 hypothetical protein [Arcobacter lacus]MDN5095282.1 hypothetical protein [Aliarcobacter butzleri]
MKKFGYTSNGKLKISTGFKTFDEQSNYLGTGNVIANTQFSWYLRPTYETECNGFPFKERELFESDIKKFQLVNSYFRKIIEDFTDKYGGSILYCFSYKKRKENVRIGYLLTSKDKSKYEVFGTKNMKREDCIYSLLPYFTESQKVD